MAAERFCGEGWSLKNCDTPLGLPCCCAASRSKKLAMAMGS